MRSDGNGNVVINKGILALVMLLLSGLVFVAGTYTDLGRNKQRISTNERDIRAIQQILNDNTKILMDIQDRLARIEVRLERRNEQN